MTPQCMKSVCFAEIRKAMVGLQGSVGVSAVGLRQKKGASQNPQRNRYCVGGCWWVKKEEF